MGSGLLRHSLLVELLGASSYILLLPSFISHQPVCLLVVLCTTLQVRRTLEAEGVPAEKQFDGFIVTRFGAQGTAMSIYVRDPDDNVVELRTYASKQPDADAKCT